MIQLKRTLFFFVFSVFCIIGVGPTAHADTTTGLVGWWTFDGKDTNWTTGITLDKSGNGNNGSLINMSTTTSPSLGKIGQALYFDNVNDFINTSIPILSRTVPNGFSVFTWIKVKTGGSYAIEMDGSDALVLGTQIPNDLSPNCHIANSSNQYFNLHPNYTFDGKWHHYGCVLDRTTNILTMYIDSASTTSMYVGGAGGFDYFYSSGEVFHLGGRVYGTGGFDGSLDDVRVYNRNLSQSEVTQLYKSGATKLGVSPTGTSGTGLNAGLIGYWTFDGKDTNWNTGTILDRSGNGNTGHLINMSTTTSPAFGKIGQALKFNGTSNYVDIANSSSVADNLPNFTVSTWFNTSAPPFSICGSPIVIKSSADTCNGVGWMILIGDSGVGATSGAVASFIQGPTVANWVGKCTTAAYNNGKWHHAVMVVTGGNTMTLYVDGSTSGTTDCSGGTIGSYSNAGNIRIGGDNGTEYFKGTTDDTHVYNRALSATEVTQLYKQGAAKLGVSPTGTSGTGLNSGLVGYWTFDGKDTNWTTGTILDRSGNGNTGHLINMSTTTSPAFGKIGQALRFSPGTTYITMGSPASLDLGSEITYSFWYKLYRNTPLMRIMGNYTNGTEVEFAANNGLVLNVLGGTSSTITGIRSGTGVWQHITITYSVANAITKFYSNGVFFGSVPGVLTPSSAGDDFEIMQPGFGDGSPIILDDVRAYNRVLSAAEITQLYKLGASVRR